MSEPPPKKIVSKKQYLILGGKKAGLYGLSAGMAVVGVGVLVDTIIHILHWKTHPNILVPGVIGALTASIFGAVWGLFLTASAVVWSGRLLKRGKAIAPVQPLTDRNVHLLPPQDTLVRGSDASPIEQQSVLLRAVQKGGETPSEQLLRAGQGKTE
jgi:hypothetical protein